MKLLTVLMVLAGTALFFATEARNAPDRNEWSISRGDTADSVQFAIESRHANGRWRTSSPISFASLKGLTREQMGAVSSTVKFEVARDAGTLVCDGTLHFGRGSGPFTFTLNPAYQQELEKLGFRLPSDRRPLDYFVMDVSLDYAKAVREADPSATGEDLVDMRAHGVDREYLNGMRDAGLKDLHARDYIEMRNHGVSAEYARDVKRTGFDADSQSLVLFRNHGVNADFVAELRRAGYDEPADSIVNMRNHGVDARYIQQLEAAGVKPDADDIVEFKNRGVGPEYLKGLKDAGYADLTREQVIHLRDHGVEPGFVRDAKSLGYAFTPDEFVDMRNNGVDSNYLRKVRASGFENLTAEKIIKLRQHGVD
ncbi:MAG: hypothetical protein JST65_03805 [Acidobacteria bacterium]|nr:hypothetical protein [Acidobacteriota bacterium]